MNDELKRMQHRVQRRAELKKEREQLEAQLETLEKELFALKIDAHNQQADVDLLNCFSLKNLYYDLTGKKEAMIAKETSEARAAKEKLNSAQFTMDQTAAKLESVAREIDALSGCEGDYWAYLQNQCSDLEALAQRKEELRILLQEAMDAGNTALEQIYDTLKDMENVSNWNTALAGTGWTMSMPGYLNGTQKKIEVLRKYVLTYARMLDSLPLPQDAMAAPEDIFSFPKDHFRELTGRIGAEQRLLDADAALHAEKDRFFQIQEQIEAAIHTLS